MTVPQTTLAAFVLSAAVIGFFHTLTGPDHFVPFIAMARAGAWSRRKTIAVTTICGVAHVLSSVVIGLVGLAAGTALIELTGFEALRGSLVGWLLLGFGLAYAVWGLRRAWRSKASTATEESSATNAGIAPWALF